MGHGYLKKTGHILESAFYGYSLTDMILIILIHFLCIFLSLWNCFFFFLFSVLRSISPHCFFLSTILLVLVFFFPSFPFFSYFPILHIPPFIFSFFVWTRVSVYTYNVIIYRISIPIWEGTFLLNISLKYFISFIGGSLDGLHLYQYNHFS